MNVQEITSQKCPSVLKDAVDIAGKERIQAWAELDQVKQQLAAVRAPQSPRDPHPSNGKLRELQQQLADREAKFQHAHSQNQVEQYFDMHV